MTPEEWRHIKTVFQRALELSPADRTVLLAAQSDTVRREVESLLRAYEHNNAFPETSSSDTPATVQSDQELIGRRFGPYRVLSQLGEGGMGTVWLAERADGLFTRRVALKLVHPLLMGRSMSERIAREREIVASLNHPNIAQLFDAGFAEDGQPYLALEYVEGTPLTKYCDDHHLGVGERLVLFRQVLGAVQYAHSHLVIHRDLKPSNILVSDDGKAHLLDFGIAKLLTPGAAQETQLTQIAGRALTPDYAAPEQIAGAATGAATDVYALGVILYELLSGERPYRLKRPSGGALEEAILHTEPVAPSRLPLTQETARARATSTQKLARSLKGDLDTIIGKTLKKSPSERYASANAFDADIARFLSGEAVPARPDSVAYRARKFGARHRVGIAGVSLLILTLAVGISKYLTSAPAAFAPPPHSIAVLAFVNLSGDKEQEYFSDGLTEELLSSLTRVSELHVAAQTSSFYFKGKDVDLGTIARTLNVGAVLEGSVRRSGHRLRITAQLIDAVTGFHLWSQTYERSVGEVLSLQTEIANAVANALEVTLLSDTAAKIELGGTRNPAAFEAYLRGLKASSTIHNRKDEEAAIAAYGEAIRLDRDYALALAARAFALAEYAGGYVTGPAVRASVEAAQTDARQAIARAPALAEGHLALARILDREFLDFAHAAEEYQRAVSLAPGNAQVAKSYGSFEVMMGHTDAGIDAVRRAVRLDPLNASVHRRLTGLLLLSGRYNDAIQAAQQTLVLDPDNPGALAGRGLAYYSLREYESAAASCEVALPRASAAGSDFYVQVCLALAYDKLGRHAEAEAQLSAVRSWYGDRGAYQYAQVYSQWGDVAKALEWLDTAFRLRDGGLEELRVDPLMDPLRNEPRYQAIERGLKFPN
jgi:serine/threonine protein kinase/tetratricopeptide (TPR) repeat protein